ncbi:class I SAM-dependent methyltransferase [Actinomadura rupiterrae]|uniref:class I SAM-dependent methyltransferase n=1 Tax=Actinomadura rupiterrae TaxID=559627 RepID=UPI0020A39754|nr:class I SAM-dependent methyltransferase [Actinomadura rupiterrae]MCP2339776.1 ubiquinone/menaquinone biosynthesis C-methylase UbiE [Actinomadura rupiterrae]
MGLRGLVHGTEHDHGESGGTLRHPRAYEFVAGFGFLGRRRETFLRLAALAGARPGVRVLDVGCGTGYLTRILSTVVGDGEVVGLDPSEPMVEYARRRAPANCTYVVAGGRETGLPDGSFDVVVSSLAVHHMPVDDRAPAFAEMFRVLRPGGTLLIAEFRPPSNRLVAALTGHMTGPAMRHSPKDLLGTLIPDAGFEVVDEGDLPVMLSYVKAHKPAR